MGLWNMLAELKKCRWVELSHTLNNGSPFWSGIPEGSVELCKTVFDYDSEMLRCRIHTFKFPGQFGTHIDFPNHFIDGAPGPEIFSVADHVLPLVVIDIRDKVAENPEYAITLADIEAFEAEHGVIPAGAFVALCTGWCHRWPSNDALNNFDDEGGEHAPGWSLPVVRFLVEERAIAAIGHETFDTDASPEAAREGDLACERYILDSGRFQVEVMDNLDQLPATGAIIFIAYPRIEGATGLPVRAWAVYG
ncbi:cyclase family protein [Coriobacteriales bacterium OH1046]|nr:cyclase family protein [Coriobacteriales bacterium OH1046]